MLLRVVLSSLRTLSIVARILASFYCVADGTPVGCKFDSPGSQEGTSFYGTVLDGFCLWCYIRNGWLYHQW